MPVYTGYTLIFLGFLLIAISSIHQSNVEVMLPMVSKEDELLTIKNKKDTPVVINIDSKDYFFLPFQTNDYCIKNGKWTRVFRINNNCKDSEEWD